MIRTLPLHPASQFCRRPYNALDNRAQTDHLFWPRWYWRREQTYCSGDRSRHVISHHVYWRKPGLLPLIPWLKWSGNSCTGPLRSGEGWQQKRKCKLPVQRLNSQSHSWWCHPSCNGFHTIRRYKEAIDYRTAIQHLYSGESHIWFQGQKPYLQFSFQNRHFR